MMKARNNGMTNGGNSGVTLGDDGLDGCHGYLILWNAQGVQGSRISA